MTTNTTFLDFYKKYYKEIRQLITVVFLVGVLSMYFDQYLLSHFLLDTKYHSSVFDWVVISIGALMIIFWIINLKLAYRYSFQQFLVLLSLSIIYLVIVHFSNHVQYWTFKSLFFKCFSKVTYITFLHNILLIYYFYFGMQIFSQISNGKEKPSQNRYLEDVPNKSDESKYKDITKEVQALIKETKFKSAFSVAVLGKWGQGKSTFIEELKYKIKDEDYIIIDFLPFYSQKEDELVMDFFTSLKESLRFYSGNISRNIEDYAISLLKIYKRGELESLLKSNALSNKGIKSRFELIKNDIEQIDKKIIIFIDDVDRLNEKEIIQILKLIRNSSNFPNVYFFLCFDKEYVLNEVIKEKEFITQSNYLDKFFQLEIVIPEYRNLNLAKNLIEYLHRQGLSEFVDSCKVNPLFVDCLDNYRDIIRFSNQLKFYKLTVGSILKELSNESFILIVLLQYKFPLAHKVLFTWKDKLLTIVEGYFVPVSRKDFEEIFFENNTELVYDENDSPTSISWQSIKDYKSNFSDHKLLNSKIDIYSEEDFDLIYNICEKLFPRVNKSVSQFNYAHNFFKYYTYTASDILISYEETLYIIQKNDLNQLDILLEEKSNLKYFFEFTIYIVESKSVEYDNILLVLNHIDKKYCDWVGQQDVYEKLFKKIDDNNALEEQIVQNILSFLKDSTWDLLVRLKFLFPTLGFNKDFIKEIQERFGVDEITNAFMEIQMKRGLDFIEFLNAYDIIRDRPKFDGNSLKGISRNYLEMNLEYVLVNILESTNNFEYKVHNNYKYFFGSFKQMQEYLSRDLYSANKKVAEFLQFIELSSLTGENPIIFDFKELNLSLNQFLNNQETKNKINCQFLLKMLERANLHQFEFPRISRPTVKIDSYIIYESITVVNSINDVINYKDTLIDMIINIANELGFTRVENSIISKDNYKFKIVDDYDDVIAELIYFNYVEI